MDNKRCMNLMMMNEARRRLVEQMAITIIAAAASFGKSQDEILNLMNIAIKAELEKRKESAGELEKFTKQFKKEIKDMYGLDLDNI